MHTKNVFNKPIIAENKRALIQEKKFKNDDYKPGFIYNRNVKGVMAGSNANIPIDVRHIKNPTNFDLARYAQENPEKLGTLYSFKDNAKILRIRESMLRDEFEAQLAKDAESEDYEMQTRVPEFQAAQNDGIFPNQSNLSPDELELFNDIKITESQIDKLPVTRNVKNILKNKLIEKVIESRGLNIPNIVDENGNPIKDNLMMLYNIAGKNTMLAKMLADQIMTRASENELGAFSRSQRVAMKKGPLGVANPFRNSVAVDEDRAWEDNLRIQEAMREGYLDEDRNLDTIDDETKIEFDDETKNEKSSGNQNDMNTVRQFLEWSLYPERKTAWSLLNEEQQKNLLKEINRINAIKMKDNDEPASDLYMKGGYRNNRALEEYNTERDKIIDAINILIPNEITPENLTQTQGEIPVDEEEIPAPNVETSIPTESLNLSDNDNAIEQDTGDDSEISSEISRMINTAIEKALADMKEQKNETEKEEQTKETDTKEKNTINKFFEIIPPTLKGSAIELNKKQKKYLNSLYNDMSDEDKTVLKNNPYDEDKKQLPTELQSVFAKYGIPTSKTVSKKIKNNFRQKYVWKMMSESQKRIDNRRDVQPA